MVTQRLLWMKNLPQLDSDYRLYCIYLFIENGFGYFFFNYKAFQCTEVLFRTYNDYLLLVTMALSFFDSGK